jgi:poly(hydroxyalkanoate) depolymerase family esterase
MICCSAATNGTVSRFASEEAVDRWVDRNRQEFVMRQQSMARHLGDVLARITDMRNHAADLAQAGVVDASPPLREIEQFGSNPGNLRLFLHVPERVAARPALVVVLHGCIQSAGLYVENSGWRALADRHGFIILAPQQKEENNLKNCFNWFQRVDTDRDSGEALSIRQMIAHVVADHRIAPRRIFVTGLSAGGAMAVVMLATYPELFAGGAVIAGLPYRTTGGAAEAFEHMRGGHVRPAGEAAAALRRASPGGGPWPPLSIWHGEADRIVHPRNGEEIARQWAAVQGHDAAPQRRSRMGRHERLAWLDDDGQDIAVLHKIEGMGHGLPLALRDVANGVGTAGPHFLDVGLSSTVLIASAWGLAPAEAYGAAETEIEPSSGHARQSPRPFRFADASKAKPQPDRIGGTITRALRAAGLMQE